VDGVVGLWNCVGKRVRERMAEGRAQFRGLELSLAITFSLKLLPPRYQSNRETQIPWYNFKLFTKSQFKYALRDTEEFEFLDLVEFMVVAFSVETVIAGSADNLVARIGNECRYGGWEVE